MYRNVMYPGTTVSTAWHPSAGQSRPPCSRSGPAIRVASWLALALLAGAWLAVSSTAQQGPANRKQIATINLHRHRIVGPAAQLYSAAVNLCGTSAAEEQLVARLADLAGCAYTFDLVLIDPDRYLSNRDFKRRVDAAFKRLQDAVGAIEALTADLPQATWRQIGASWQPFKDAYGAVAPYWTGDHQPLRRLQAVELEATTTVTRVGDPVGLKVFARYGDGSREPVTNTEVSWLIRPERSVTVNSAQEFLAHEAGIYQVTAVYRELMTPSVVIRVKRQPQAFVQRDLTGTFLGHKQNFALVKSIACKVPDETFNALRIRILERPARVGDLTVYFADGTRTVLWKNRQQLLEPGEYLLGSFLQGRKILRFDVRTQGDGGHYSRQTLIGVRRKE